MNSDHAFEMLKHIPFNAVDNFVRVIYIAIVGNFGVEGNDFSPGAVVVNDNVVYARHFGILFHKAVNLFDELRIGGRAEK